MPRLMRRFMAPGTLAAYLLAVVAASSHHHGHEHSGDSQATIASRSHGCCHPAGHCHGTSGHCHSHGPGHSDELAESPASGHSPQHHPGGLPHHHHDDCVVCQFLALKTVSVPVVTLTVLTETVPLAEPEAVVRPDAPAPSLPFSRGPPSTAVV